MPTVISKSTVGRRSSSSTSIVVRDPVTGRNVIVLKNIQDEDFRRLLSPFDTNGDGVIDEEELIRAATSSVVINEQTGRKVIVLADVEMDLQEYLGKFDINNDGEIDEEELIRAAKSYAETKQQNRFLKLAVAGVIGTSVIIIGSLSGVIHGVVHNEVEKSKDTEIQSGTGNLMVKTSSSTAADDTVVEVSTKSRGSFFMAEMISDDRNDGVLNSSNNKGGIVCVSADELEEMALSVMGGSTHTNFAVTDVNGNVKVHDLSQNGVVDWNENSVSLGSVTFTPSQGCGGVNEERKLDESDFTGLHTELRNRVLSKIGLMGRGGDGGEKAMMLANKDSGEAQLRLGGRKLEDDGGKKIYEEQVSWIVAERPECENEDEATSEETSDEDLGIDMSESGGLKVMLALYRQCQFQFPFALYSSFYRECLNWDNEDENNEIGRAYDACYQSTKRGEFLLNEVFKKAPNDLDCNTIGEELSNDLIYDTSSRQGPFWTISSNTETFGGCFRSATLQYGRNGQNVPFAIPHCLDFDHVFQRGLHYRFDMLFNRM